MSALPDHIFHLIEELTSKESLSASYESLSDRYRGAIDKRLSNHKEYLAYLASRMPATFAACSEVMQRMHAALPEFRPSTLLDVGAGPGTLFIALQEYYATLQRAEFVERDAHFTELSKNLLSSYSANLSWQQEIRGDEQFDLVTSSYMLSELADIEIDRMIQAFMQKATSAIMLIDTGTPLGYKGLIRARTMLIENGWKIVAPCPHNKACPIQAPDWCHFSIRLPRSRLHKAVKGAERGFEDEKFCYIIASKHEAVQKDESRIVGMPMQRSGHVKLKLCTPQGTIDEAIISRKMKERYQLAKKAEWGDIL